MDGDRITELGRIDPERADVATAPKPKPKRRQKKPPMPKMLEPWAEKARERMKRRPASPGVVMEPLGPHGAFSPASPHDNPEVWELQIHDAFGTRSPSTVRVFLDQLRALCGQHYDGEAEIWRPSETEISAALNFVTSMQPRNEMEAALAAQMLAVHWMMMKMSAHAINNGEFPDRSMSVAGKLARTYAMQAETLSRIRGKARSTRQHITVKHEKHIHSHQHVAFVGHAETPGAWTRAPSSGGPSHDHGDHHDRSIEQAGAASKRLSALQGDHQIGEVVPLSGRKRKAGL